MNPILIAVLSLGAIGLIAAAFLYIASKKFAVYEDPRIAQVAEVLPQANCGGCGYPGCAGFAAACVKADSLSGKFCPVGGQPVMEQVATILGQQVEVTEPKVAVVRCNGTCENRPHLTTYEGIQSCAVLAATYSGETGCSYGCLGCGDCEDACKFDAIHVNPITRIPEVIEDKCTSCGACVAACPKDIIELRPKGKKNRRVYVSCVNKDKGVVANKVCKTSCIGCGKCVKACPFGAITLVNNLAYIDPEICKLCRKCVAVCPKNAIIDVNFPPRKVINPAIAGNVVAAQQKAAAKKSIETTEKPSTETAPKVAENTQQLASKATVEVKEKLTVEVAPRVAAEVENKG